MDLVKNVLLCILHWSCFVQISTSVKTSSPTTDRQWNITRFKRNQRRSDVIFTLYNTSCQSFSNMINLTRQYHLKRGCECSFTTGIFYIKDQKAGCYLPNTICQGKRFNWVIPIGIDGGLRFRRGEGQESIFKEGIDEKYSKYTPASS